MKRLTKWSVTIWSYWITGAKRISMYALTWEENNKEGIETIFITPVSSVSGDKYYRLDAVRVCNDLN